MKIVCPGCHQHYEVDENYIGRSVTCQVCGKTIKVLKPVRADEMSFSPSSTTEDKSIGKIYWHAGIAFLLFLIIFSCLYFVMNNTQASGNSTDAKSAGLSQFKENSSGNLVFDDPFPMKLVDDKDCILAYQKNGYNIFKLAMGAGLFQYVFVDSASDKILRVVELLPLTSSDSANGGLILLSNARTRLGLKLESVSEKDQKFVFLDMPDKNNPSRCRKIVIDKARDTWDSESDPKGKTIRITYYLLPLPGKSQM